MDDKDMAETDKDMLKKLDDMLGTTTAGPMRSDEKVALYHLIDRLASWRADPQFCQSMNVGEVSDMFALMVRVAETPGLMARVNKSMSGALRRRGL